MSLPEVSRIWPLYRKYGWTVLRSSTGVMCSLMGICLAARGSVSNVRLKTNVTFSIPCRQHGISTLINLFPSSRHVVVEGSSQMMTAEAWESVLMGTFPKISKELRGMA